jgi:arylsulfatase A-like enzyme
MVSRLLLPALCAAVWPGLAEAAENPPNIVVILADDLGLRDLKLYGGWLEAPRIERMAREGMMFTDFHANSSVCSPTRTAFLTGRYQQRLDIVDVIVGVNEPDKGIPATTPTLAKVLQENGYATALFGKWHCGYEDKFNPVHLGFDEFVGFLHGGGDFHRHRAWRNGLEVEEVQGYSTDIITDRSVDYIRRHKEKPFFLYIAHQTPHNPYQTRADVPDKRPEGWKENRIGEENRPRYREMIGDLDDSVGRILDTLTENGLSDRTLVFFWSDNGDVGMSPVEGPRRGTKFSHYEGGHRVPAIALWPGQVPAGARSNALLAGFDLFPTFLSIAGVDGENPPRFDGISFKDRLLGHPPAVEPVRDLFFGYEPKLGTAMRRGDWKMIMKEGNQQLFDLASDPRETTDIAAGHPEEAAAMREAIERFKETVVPGS